MLDKPSAGPPLWCGNVPFPPCGESDVHLGFALSIKIMLIRSNLLTDAQAGSTRPEQREKDNMCIKSCCTTVCEEGFCTKKISKPFCKAFKIILVSWHIAEGYICLVFSLTSDLLLSSSSTVCLVNTYHNIWNSWNLEALMSI